MATPTGTISINDVMTELGIAGATALGDTDVRGLAGVPSGVISLDNLRGKSGATDVYVTTGTDQGDGSKPTGHYYGWWELNYAGGLYHPPATNGAIDDRYALSGHHIRALYARCVLDTFMPHDDWPIVFYVTLDGDIGANRPFNKVTINGNTYLCSTNTGYGYSESYDMSFLPTPCTVYKWTATPGSTLFPPFSNMTPATNFDVTFE